MRRTLRDFVAEIVRHFPPNTPAADNAIRISLAGIYHAYGRTKANEAIEAFNLGLWGFKEFD